MAVKYVTLFSKEIPNGRNNFVVVTISSKEGSNERRLDIRTWFIPEGEEEMRATSKGVNLPLDKGAEIINIINEAMTHATTTA